MNYAKDDLLFAPLGGSGEIGMNVNLYHYQDNWIMVDLGISFPDESTPGVDVILPDLKFIADRRDKLAGLVLTHGHEDHIGAIPYLWSQLGCPIYGSAFTLALLRRKLAESRGDFDIKLHEIGMNAPFKLGAFEIEMVALNHSIPDPAALAIRTDAGTVFHTGDWKFDKTPVLGTDTDAPRLAAIGDEGVLALVGDSTNAMVDGRTGSESDAKAGLTDAIAKATGRVAITCFASNVARIDSICKAAKANGRSVAIVGRALNRAISAAREVGYLADLPDLVPEGDVDLLPRDSIVIVCTGTQGEPRAAMARIAAAAHDTISLEAGDTVIYSSRQIPGNENAIARVQDMLIRRKIHLVTDQDAPVHVSGHPSRGEMIEMYGLIRPKIAIPVHGTARHLLAHAALADSFRNGIPVRFQFAMAVIIEKRRSFGISKANFNIFILFFQKLTDTGKRSPRSDSANKPVNLSSCLIPDFRASGLVMAFHIGRIVKLVCPNHTAIMCCGQLFCQSFGIANIIIWVFVGGSRHKA